MLERGEAVTSEPMIVIGSGLLGALIATVAAILVWKVVRPAYRNLRADVAKVSGKYATFDSPEADAPRVGWAHIEQAGRVVKLRVTRQINRRGEDQEKPTSFVYRGFFQSGLLTALFTDQDASYRSGAIVLDYDSARHKFTGKTMYRDSSDGVQAYFFELRYHGG